MAENAVMKLYSIPHSPYAARVRVQIYARQLPVEIVDPPGGMGSEALRQRNPMGKVPVLELGDDCVIESAAIMEYLEDHFADQPLRRGDALAVARQRALIRYTDLYLAPALFPLFQALRNDPKKAPPEQMQALDKQLDTLEALLQGAGKERGGEMNLADCALVPVMFYVERLLPLFGEAPRLEGERPLASWWQGLRKQPPVAQVLQEMGAGLDAMLEALKPAPASR